jgi:hypothetical protein
MSSTASTAGSASLPAAVGAASSPALGALPSTASGTVAASSNTMVSPSSATLSAHSSSPALGISGDFGSVSTAAPGVPLSNAIYSVTIKSLVPYTLDLQAHNFSKWRTLFSMVLGRFSLVHHVEDDATYPADLEWTKENLLVGN